MRVARSQSKAISRRERVLALILSCPWSYGGPASLANSTSAICRRRPSLLPCDKMRTSLQGNGKVTGAVRGMENGFLLHPYEVSTGALDGHEMVQIFIRVGIVIILLIATVYDSLRALLEFVMIASVLLTCSREVGRAVRLNKQPALQSGNQKCQLDQVRDMVEWKEMIQGRS